MGLSTVRNLLEQLPLSRRSLERLFLNIWRADALEGVRPIGIPQIQAALTRPRLIRVISGEMSTRIVDRGESELRGVWTPILSCELGSIVAILLWSRA